MNLFSLDPSLSAALNSNNPNSFQLKKSFENNFNNQQFIIIDDGNTSNVKVLKSLLNLNSLENSLDILYMGSYNNHDLNELIHFIKEQTEKNNKIILVGFQNLTMDYPSFKDWTYANISCHQKYSSTHRLTNIGYQRHLFENTETQNNFWDIGLGILKNNLNLAELSIRNTEFLSISLDILKRSEIPSNPSARVHGIFSEQFCQLSKLCGTTSRIKVSQFLGLSSEATAEELEILADSIWYFLEGCALQIQENPESSNHMQSFVIQSQDMSHDYSFVKSKLSGKIWYLCTNKSMEGKYIPCSEQEFNDVSSDNIPYKILLHT